MAEVVASKLKLLHLARIFERETDDDHGLTAPQIIGKLAELGVNVERKTLYRDIDCLRAFGYNILKYNRAPVEYGLATRDFQGQELLLLADAVQSSKFLTESKSRSLVEGIGKLGSKYMDENLRKQVHVEGRIKSQNESVFYNIDAIQRAISLRRKIEFRYFKYDEHKKRVTSKHGDGSEIYKETPVQLAYMDDEYYLIVWNDKYAGFTHYRVDRMQNLEVSSEVATRNDEISSFDVAKHQQRVFGMFHGESVGVTLLVRGSVMSAIVDRFGKDVEVLPAEDGWARVCVTVMAAPTFYGWLATFGSSVQIEEPQSLRQAYAGYLSAILENYQ